MPNQTFYTVDVFAEEKYAGNQLAVITDACNLTSVQMQRIANEMHFSETTFVLSSQPRRGGYDVRIFTPTTEVPFAGHPTLGTAYIIKQFIASEKTDKVLLNLKVGQIPVDFKKNQNGKEVLWMTQSPPTFGKTFTGERFARILGVETSEIESKCPIQEVSTGLPFIIVPLKTLGSVKRAHVNSELQCELAERKPFGDSGFLSSNLQPRKRFACAGIR